MKRSAQTRRTIVTIPLLFTTLLSIGVARNAAPVSAAPRTAAVPSCISSMPAPTGTRGTALARAGNTFGFTLFHRLFNGAPKNDLFVSPLSVALALDMLYDGARGTTATAMAKTLGLQGMTPQQVNSAAATLLHALQTGEPAQQMGPGFPGQPTKLRVANSVWSHNGLTFKAQFISDLQRYFGAQAQSLDFTTPAAANTINGWVSCETNGKIKQIIPSTAGLLMLLINAVYFEGGWTLPFSASQTRSEPFTTGTGATLQVPMMHQTHYYGYVAGNDFQAVTIPYNVSQRFSMVLVLPRKGISLAQFAPRLTRDNWGYWVKHMKVAKYGDIAIPRVDMKYSTSLKAPLSAMGMSPAFGPQANFTGICTAFCKVNEVLHKTFLHIDEKGTTAAAVTAVGLGGGGPLPTPFHFVADHPFFLGIRDGRSGAVLFLGAVNKP